ncbi:MAG TPA: metal ABC transporter permease, partial [Thermoplasmatales archaeon]|nr:metal ABC transporter permease [Thermoplasmatales archaeon]
MNELSLFDLPRLFSYQFFQHALLGGTIAALVCAWVGLFLILRKEAMIG